MLPASLNISNIGPRANMARADGISHSFVALICGSYLRAARGDSYVKNMGLLVGNHILFRKLNKKNEKPSGLALLSITESNV